jgi:hypothetical protein
MTFWSSSAAAPSFLMTLPFYNRRPQYLRTDMPPLCPETYTFSDGSTAKVKRLFGSNAEAVGAFLTKYYIGDDWRITHVENWIGAYLRDAEVVALGLWKGDTLIATIFSVPIGTTLMSHGGLIRNMRVIEGLCVSPAYRSKGLAGFMIAHADAFTSYKFGVCAHLWARELDSYPLINTALTVDYYGYRATGGIKDETIRSIPWDSFVQLWTSNSSKWVLATGGSRPAEPCIVATEPANRRGRNTVYFGYGGLAVISDTERTGADGKHIYEIVWSGRFDAGGLMPATADFDFKQLMDGVASLLPGGGVLFGTCAPSCGGLRADWEGWAVGRSGHHALYLYNYMPPAFGACRIHIVRDEL